MNETPVFDHTMHKKLWNWLADNPVNEEYDYEWGEDDICESFNEKTDAFEAFGIDYDDEPVFECYACQYVQDKCGAANAGVTECPECPLQWQGNEFNYSCYNFEGNAFYSKWKDATSAEERSKWARVIANLKVKPGVETC